LLHLSTIPQHYDLGFSSVVSLVDDLEQQIESLTLAHQSPNHLQHLEQGINSQHLEIQRLGQTITNKSNQLLRPNRQNYQLQKQFQSRLDKEQHINHQLHHQLQLKISPAQQSINRLQTQIDKLKVEISESNQLILQLKIKIRELERALESDKLPSIKLDSHNSSLPPSLDLPWNKPKQTQSLRQKSGLQVGGQLGHQGSTLLQVHNPDLIVVHQVNDCQHCHYSFVNIASIRCNKRQIFEIENGTLTIIEHQTEVKLCPFCQKMSKGHFPENIKAPVQYGSFVFSRIVYLNQYQLLPVARTAETMNDLFECPLSWATIKRATKTCADNLIQVELKIKARLRNANVMGVDETCININGENNWVHLTRTDESTHFAFHQKRGKVAFEEIGIINRFHGILVRDGFASYQKYEQCQHGLCNAHILRNLTFISENEPAYQAWTTKLAKLLVRIKDKVESARLNGQSALTFRQQSCYSAHYDRIMTEAWKTIRGSPERKLVHISAHNLYRRCYKYKKAILRSMTDFSVPFDNNGSERDLRMLKLQQKISGCFRTTEGVKVFCRVRSYLSSARKQGRGLLIAIEQALLGKPSDLVI